MASLASVSRGTAHAAIPAVFAVIALLLGGVTWFRGSPATSGEPASAVAPGDTTVVFGPLRLDAPVRQAGDSAPIVSHFPTQFTVNPALQHRYVVRVTNGNPDGSERVLSASVDGRRIDDQTGVVTFEIAARSSHVLDVRINAQPAPGHLTLEVLDVTGGAILVFGMERFSRGTGPAVATTRTFTVDAGAGAPFFLWVVNGNADGTSRLTSATVQLNGTLVSPVLSPSTATAMVAVTPVRGLNELQIVLPEQAPGFVDLGISATDVAAPVLTVAAPAPGLITRDTVVTVAGTVTDGSAVAVTVNGSVATLSGNSYFATVALAEGDNALAIAAVDAAGARTDSSRLVVRDRTAPTLAVATPAEGFVAGQAAITVSGSVTDATPVTVTANGVPLPVDAAGTFTGSVPLASGATVMSVTATDAANNGSTTVRVGIKDVAVPLPFDGGMKLTNSVVAQEPFTGTGALSSNWTAFDTPALRYDNMLIGDSEANNLAYWDADAFSPDQYSQIVLGDSSGEVGVAVRVSGTAMSNANAYWLEHSRLDPTEIGLHKYVNGTMTTDLRLYSGLSFGEGDTLRLEVTGATLRIKINGVQIGTDVTDTDIATGAAGFLTGHTSIHQADNWEGGDISAQIGDGFAQENFTGTGSLSADWTALGTAPLRDDDMLRGNSSARDLAFWDPESFSANQYSQLILGENPAEVGVAVRVSGTSLSNVSAYWLEYHDVDSLGLHKYVGGSGNHEQLAVRTGLSLAAGDVIRLEVNGTRLRIKVNGRQLGTVVTDDDIATGAVGFVTGTTAEHQGDYWEGGNLANTGAALAREAFTGSGPLPSNWTALRELNEPPVRDEDMLRGNDDEDENDFAYWNAAWFSPDQYSQIVLGAGASPHELGVAVRVSGESPSNIFAYWLEYNDSTWIALHKYAGGLETYQQLAERTGLSLQEGDTMRLEVQGTTLRIKINGVQLGAAVTDDDIATGVAGLNTGNSEMHQADNWEGGDLEVLPPDPATVAPPIPQVTSTSMHTSTEFLYTGDNPIQTGVEPGTIEPLRVAVLRGKVLDRGDDPLPGVTIRIKDHPELGQTLSRADGRFDLAVNGGGVLTLDYVKSGYLPAQRQVAAPWQDFASVDDVILVQLDTAVTTIAFEDTVEVARGSVVSDDDGTRRTTMLFMPGTTAEMITPGGDTIALTSMAVRATEYTVGGNGPKAMPAPLPSTSNYTFAVELSDDAAIDSGATVKFNQPVPTYVENFLDFPVGMVVPIGSYDRLRGVWVPEPDGRVIKILSISGDAANLDVDGDAAADDSTELAALGITPAERITLADLYSANQSLWRAPISHFTPHDWNLPPDWPRDPDDPAIDGGGDNHENAQVDNPCEQQGNSVIECQNQVLGETIGLVGTPFTLNYRSNRVPGFGAAMKLDIRVTRLRVPQALIGSEVRVSIAGRDTTVVFPRGQFQTLQYRWDGRDAYGRLTSGRREASYTVAYVYPQQYLEPVGSDLRPIAFGHYCSKIVNNQIVPCDTSGTVSSQRFVRRLIGGSAWLGPLNAWNALGQGIGGWSLDVHHAYDPGGRLLYLGTGERVEARDIRRARLVAGGSATPGGNGGPATLAGFGDLADVVAGPDGGFYLSDPDDHTVRRVRPDGAIEAFAGTTASSGFSGDGGSATAAQLNLPRGLALGSDGSVFIADAGNHRVRRVTPSGIIETFAGTGTSGFSGDGGPAISADLGQVVAVTAAPDGSVYIADQSDTTRVRKVSTDARIITIAGGGTDPDGCGADSIPAAATCFPEITDLTWGPDGALYVLEGTLLRRIDPDGVTKRIAGDSTKSCSTERGDNGPARDAGLCATSVAVAATGEVFLADNQDYLRVIERSGIIRRFASGACGFDDVLTLRLDPTPILVASAALVLPSAVDVLSPCLFSIALAPDGSVLATDPAGSPDTNRVHRFEPALPGLALTSFVVAAQDGSELYVFGSDGRHLETRDALTGTTTLTFAYDSAGRLISITDADSNVTTIERNGTGEPTAIVGPFGQESMLDVDSLGYLTTVTNPADEVVRVSHDAGGLLQYIVNPLGDTSAFTFDDDGLLTRDDDPAGGFVELERAALGTDPFSMDSSVITMTTAEGRVTRYDVERLGAGRRTQSPAGLATTSSIEPNANGLQQTRTLTPDGTLTTVTTRGDPRFPTAAVLDSMQIKTPDEIISEVLARRTVELSDPDDPLSLVTQTDSVTVNDNTTVSVYTASTRRQVTTTPEGRTFTTQLDSVGRVTMARAANLDSVMFSYDSRGRLEEQQQGGRAVAYGYNASDGRLQSVTDPLGRATQFEYDSAGRVTTQIRPDSSEILLAYDSAGNLTSLTPPGRPAHGFQYNAVGLVTQYDPPTIGGSAKPTKYFYNLDRQLDSIVRPDSITVALGYDAAGRPNAVTFDRGTLTLGYSNTTGNLNRIRTPEGDSLLFTYDGSLPTQVRWSGTVDGTVGVVYDNDFRVASQTVNGANAVLFSYDDDGLLASAGALVLGRSATNGLLLADTLGRVRSAYQYSSRGELSGYRVKHDTTTLFATGYTRDSLGRIAQLFDTTQGTAKRWSFVYDTLGRLVKDSVNGAVFHVFTYDANGNRLSSTSGAGTVNYSYDNQDRLLWARVGTDTTHYTYGSNGELKTKTVPGVGTTTYSYDALGNLISVVLPDSTEIEYVVDGQNRRVGRKVDGDVVRTWLYQNQLKPIAELDTAGNVVSRFVYGSRANVPDFMIRSDSVFRFLTDHLGSVRLVVDTATGTVAQRLDYDEWGNVLTNTNPGFQPFGFAGGLPDEETGLVRFGARDYDPWSCPCSVDG